MSAIAGHEFNSWDVCSCGKRWTDIMHVDRSCISKEGFAHSGELRDYEYDQIEAERDRREKLYAEATLGVAAQ
jgi:hypothetical protein